MQSSNPSIIYAVVVRGSNVVLSEYSTATGNYIAFAKTIISKVNSQNAKKSFNYEQYEFHILVEDGFSFLIMSEKGLKMRIAFACLEDMKTRFFAMFSQQQRDQAISYGLNSQFSQEQKTKIEYYNSPQADKLRTVSDNIQQTKEIMMESLDKLLERGEKIDILVEKTNVMVNISTEMKNNATTLRRQMWWRNKKMTILLVLIVQKEKEAAEKKQKEAEKLKQQEQQAEQKKKEQIIQEQVPKYEPVLKVPEEPPKPEVKENEQKVEEEGEKKDGEKKDDNEKFFVGNGGRTERYIWTQTLEEVQVYVPIPAGLTAKQLNVKIEATTLIVQIKGQDPIINGTLYEKIQSDESIWTLTDGEIQDYKGKYIHLSLTKWSGQMHWWACVFKGDKEINTQKINPEPSQLSDLDGETRGTVEKMMFDMRQKQMGLPTSEELEKKNKLAEFMKAHPEMDFSKCKFN